MRTEVLGIGYDDLSPDQALGRALEMIRSGGFHYAVFPDDLSTLLMQKQPRFRDALNAADLVLPAGAGIIYAADILQQPLKYRYRMPDFAKKLCDGLAGEGCSLFILGGRPGAADLAARKLKESCPGLEICGVRDSAFPDDDRAEKVIRRSGADVVLVCLGSPEQEYWMVEHGPGTGASLLLGMHDAADILAEEEREPDAVRFGRDPDRQYRLAARSDSGGQIIRIPRALRKAIRARLKERRDHARKNHCI